MNLHAIVSGAIGSVNKHELVTIYRCNGTTNNAGVVSVTYTPSDIMAQVQAPNAGDLRLFDNLADAKHVKKFYLNASAHTIISLLLSKPSRSALSLFNKSSSPLSLKASAA